MASTGSPMQWRVAILHDSGVSLHTTTIRPASRTLLVAFAMLPFASNAKHTGVWPFFAAKCSGVQPCCNCTQQWCEIKAVTGSHGAVTLVIA